MSNDLSFLDSYWEFCEKFPSRSASSVASGNHHFNTLNEYLLQEIASHGISEYSIKMRYRIKKRWDLCFIDKKVLIEYKSMSDRDNRWLNIGKNAYNMIEKAIGNAVDTKNANPDFKLGYIYVFFLRDRSNLLKHKKKMNELLTAFERMVDDGIYDFFCPIISFGKNDHMEMSNHYTLNRFLFAIKDIKVKTDTPFNDCLQESIS